MQIAWFSPLPPVRSGIAAYSAELLPQLRDRFVIDSYPEADAHDFVWKHRRTPYDLVVYQLGNATCHDYMWAYLAHYPGLVVLHDAKLHHARARQLLQHNRADDYRREFSYDHPDTNPDFAEYAVLGLGGTVYYFWPMLRVVMRTARAVAVHSAYVADDLRQEYAGTVVETIRMGVPHLTPAPDARATVRGALNVPAGAFVFTAFGKVTAEKRIAAMLRALGTIVGEGRDAYLVLVGDAEAYPALAEELRRRGVASRVRVTGHVADETIADHLEAADACLCLRWPTAQESSASWLRCLAASTPTVRSDLAHLADIPDAVALRVDLLDGEASLTDSMRRFVDDRALRDRIAAAGHQYWRAHHTLEHMAADYHALLARAATLPAPSPTDLPGHFADDHAEPVNAILARFGLPADRLL